MMTSSRLVIDSYGRLVAEGTLLDVKGLRWLVLEWREMFEPHGRPPTPEEKLRTRAPYNAPKPLLDRSNSDVPDEELDDAEAIRMAMLEQRRQPVDLVNIAA